MRIRDANPIVLQEMWARIEAPIREAGSLEEAAQELATSIQFTFHQSVILARVFVNVPFQHLPEPNQTFVRSHAASAGAIDELEPDTPVLSLIGTHGIEEEWTDRRNSRGHVGIPLISSAFVEGIPMIARLMKELGMPLDGVDLNDSQMIIRSLGPSTGLFFVDDAREATDQRGRKVITQQDFVATYGVKGVFGAGGAYPDGPMIIAVVFCLDRITRSAAEQFLSVIYKFVGATAGLVDPTRVFEPR